MTLTKQIGLNLLCNLFDKCLQWNVSVCNGNFFWYFVVLALRILWHKQLILTEIECYKRCHDSCILFDVLYHNASTSTESGIVFDDRQIEVHQSIDRSKSLRSGNDPIIFSNNILHTGWLHCIKHTWHIFFCIIVSFPLPKSQTMTTFTISFIFY